MKILDNIVESYKNILGKNLVGIYLHGSLAMGCYTDRSDIDFITIVRESLEYETKRKLIKTIINMNNLPEKGIEMSVVLQKYAKEFVYPTPFELHFSDFHKARYLSDSNYVCGGNTDRDLAAHFTVIVHRGICLYGKEISEMFSNVPSSDYVDAIVYDIKNAKKDIYENPVYFTLNLCRVLYYVKENTISSKLEGGNWGKEILPQKYRKIVEDAVKVYMNELNHMHHSKDILVEYAGYMIHEIDRYINIDIKSSKM